MITTEEAAEIRLQATYRVLVQMWKAVCAIEQNTRSIVPKHGAREDTLTETMRIRYELEHLASLLGRELDDDRNFYD